MCPKLGAHWQFAIASIRSEWTASQATTKIGTSSLDDQSMLPPRSSVTLMPRFVAANAPAAMCIGSMR